MATSKTVILNGTPYLGAVGINSFKPLGNTSKLTVNANFEKKTLANFQGGGGNDDVFTRFTDGTISLDVRHMSVDLFLLALGGDGTAVAAGAVADEPHTLVALNELIRFDHMQDMAVTLTVENAAGTTTYVEGTHYVRKRAGIIPLTAAGGMAASDIIHVSYTKHKHERVQALMHTIVEKALLFDGQNERSYSPFQGMFHRVGWSPAKSLEFIGEDFMSFTIEGEILAYEGITDPTKSQFYEVLVGDL